MVKADRTSPVDPTQTGGWVKNKRAGQMFQLGLNLKEEEEALGGSTILSLWRRRRSSRRKGTLQGCGLNPIGISIEILRCLI